MLIENDSTSRKIWENVPVHLGAIAKLLLEELNKNKIDKKRIEYIKEITPIHKLTYKDFYGGKKRDQKFLVESLKNYE